MGWSGYRTISTNLFVCFFGFVFGKMKVFRKLSWIEKEHFEKVETVMDLSRHV